MKIKGRNEWQIERNVSQQFCIHVVGILHGTHVRNVKEKKKNPRIVFTLQLAIVHGYLV